MSLKHLPIGFFVKLGFDPPYFLTAPIALFRFGQFYKRNKKSNKKVPQFKNRDAYYDYICGNLINEKEVLFLEFGVYKGASLRYWSESNTNPKSLFVGFDSFKGLPDTWRHFHKTYSKEYFDVGGECPKIEDSRVSFVKGFFQDSLHDYINQNRDLLERPVQLVIHCDADMYSSTLFVLTKLDEFIRPGTIILFDEFYSAEDEYEAFRNWQSAYNRKCEVLASVQPYYQRLAISVKE